MSERKNINIDEALKAADNENIKTFEGEDRKSKLLKKKPRETIQVSVYFTEEEIEYIDRVCEQDMISRVKFVRRLLRKEMDK